MKVEFEEEEPAEDPSVAATPSVKQWFQPAAAKSKSGGGGGVTKRSTFFKDRKMVRSTLKGILNK